MTVVIGRASPPSPVFTLADAHAAAAAWGANCGPGALAAVLGVSLDAVHPHLVGFDEKRYTNPRMMRAALDSLAVSYRWNTGRLGLFPSYGLARVQWDGPWTKPGVPPAAAYRHTHWVGAAMPNRAVSDPHDVTIFDINAICVGGWIDLPQWSTQLVPWLLKQCEPKASGGWWLTHVVEIRAAACRTDGGSADMADARSSSADRPRGGDRVNGFSPSAVSGTSARTGDANVRE